MEFNAHVWARDHLQQWKQGRVTAREEKGDARLITVRFDSDGREAVYTLTASEADEGEGTKQIKLRNVKGQAGVLEGANVDDLIVLTHLHEPAILYTLEERYKQDVIYTYTGPILLAINPFWRVPLYSNSILEQYKKDGVNKAFDPDYQSALPPHVYATADSAYRLMSKPTSERQKRNQSILVSGESGAGKTETTKIIMRYLAILGGHDSRALLEGDSTVISIEQQVLQSNPILEAFGNARTVRNDNSSRFGKFIEIDFDKDGFLFGAAIRTFLLEKIRLVHTSEQERNFHIFYQMLAGATEECRKRWQLAPDPRIYHYINQSNCYARRDGVRDADLWEELQQAMRVMGMSDEETDCIFSCVSGVLNCGNVDFDDAHTSKSDELIGEPRADTLQFAGIVAQLWSLEQEALLKAMSSRRIKAGNEWFTVYLDAKKCRHSRDALCKAVYSGIFDWLVGKINNTIDRQRRGAVGGEAAGNSPAGSGLFTWSTASSLTNGSDALHSSPPPGDHMFIGLLDIFGFESFDQNYFEQFLINYANEKLQQQFNHFVFEMEAVEYRKEGIKWDFVEFPNNKDSIELIEARPAGILSLLDEQCIVPRATDQTFAGNLYKHLASHPRFKSGHDLRVDYKFMVAHYAGDITYLTAGFLEKNRDTLHQEGLDLVNSSTSKFITALGAGRRVYVIARNVVMVLQARLRGKMARRWYESERNLRASIRLQTWIRMRMLRREYTWEKRASVRLQTFVRYRMLRRKYVTKRMRVIMLQCVWRRKLARQEMLLRKREAAKVSALQAQIMAFERRFKRFEAERLAAEQAEAARVEAERAEAARLEAERLEAEQAEAARLQAERVEAARLEAERVAAEAARLEAEQLEAERLEAKRLEAKRAEEQRLAAERADAERLHLEQLEAAQAERARLAAARMEAAQLEAARLEADRAELLRLEEQNQQRAEELEALRQAEAASVARVEAALRTNSRLSASTPSVSFLIMCGFSWWRMTLSCEACVEHYGIFVVDVTLIIR
ncbi:P-loop containing nucleoside triphosphate hydrolase protein [Tribonema minus]|uniref:P-loop containing nucleoside triphosphate hydrolase protein n=1 Tax=Tribonema minus TaxID=303371 RepID=A0A835YX87_9STRA|nr:P-loop containing nucleoside triphosphate hydrolase protein [Tribonema minus]